MSNVVTYIIPLEKKSDPAILSMRAMQAIITRAMKRLEQSPTPRNPSSRRKSRKD